MTLEDEIGDGPLTFVGWAGGTLGPSPSFYVLFL